MRKSFVKTVVFGLTGLSPFLTWGKESSTCPIGEIFIKSHQRRGYLRADGSYVKPTSVKSHCRKKSPLDEFLETRWSLWPPAPWQSQREKGKGWNEEERERIRDALSQLPDRLLSRQIRGIFRGERSQEPGNRASHYENQIVLYDAAFKSDANLARSLGHELAHQLYDELSKDDQNAYQAHADWFVIQNQDGGRRVLSRSSGYVQDDGRNSPEEDFANNVEFFIFEPEKLKSVTPNVYNWLKKRFGDSLKLKK